jgi:hypothetical protein
MAAQRKIRPKNDRAAKKFRVKIGNLAKIRQNMKNSAENSA